VADSPAQVVWPDVPLIEHSDYQAVDASGNSTYSGLYPFRMRGVVLNNTENWLNPTERFSSTTFDMGGEAEIFVQAVNLDGTDYDPNPGVAFNDFSGTAAWIGQCYHNLPWIGEPNFSYIDQGMAGSQPVWYDELDRLGFNRPDTPLGANELVRAGDLVEIRARINGLNYQGKHNVNEKHTNDPANDFEVVILEKDYGLPEAASLTLGDIKDALDADIFDPMRQTGGEHYQASLVELTNVRLLDPSGWATNADLTLVDDSGRSLPIHLGLDPDFDIQPAPEGYFNVVGIMDQKGSNVGGYRLLALEYAGISQVPEPASMALLAAAGVALGVFRLRRRRGQA